MLHIGILISVASIKFPINDITHHEILSLLKIEEFS